MLFGVIGLVCWVLIVFGVVGVVLVDEDAIEEDATKVFEKKASQRKKI